MSLLCTAIVVAVAAGPQGPVEAFTGDVQFLSGCPTGDAVSCLLMNAKRLDGEGEAVEWYSRCIDKDHKLVYVGFIERTTSA